MDDNNTKVLFNNKGEMHLPTVFIRFLHFNVKEPILFSFGVAFTSEILLITPLYCNVTFKDVNKTTYSVAKIGTPVTML